MTKLKCISDEKIEEIRRILAEAHTLIKSLDNIATEFQSAMVLAESKEDRENLLKSVNLLELETDTHRAIAKAVERISVICIELHEKNLDDHHVYSEITNALKPYVKTLVTIADAYEAGSKSVKYSTAILKTLKNIGIIAAAVAAPELLRQVGLL